MAPSTFRGWAAKAANQLVEEENYSDYVASWYYPVRIGELYASRYQVVGKVGFGTTSTVFEKIKQAELDHPTPRKEVDGRVIYLSRRLEKPKTIGAPVLCHFGSAARGEEQNEDFVQPDVYRSPEVILKPPWSYPIEQLETNLNGEDKELFLQFTGKMLRWDPRDRMEPKELLKDACVAEETFVAFLYILMNDNQYPSRNYLAAVAVVTFYRPEGFGTDLAFC